MGNNFIEDDYPSTMFDLYFKNGITGEKALVYNASIRKQFEYKLEHNEKFVTEARLHHEMDLQYQVRCFNRPIMICEYQKEGYTQNINKLVRAHSDIIVILKKYLIKICVGLLLKRDYMFINITYYLAF